MQKQVFHLQYEKRTKIILYVVLAVFTLLAIREILCLCGVWSKPYSIVLDSCSLGVSAIIAIIVSSMLFGSRYVIKNNSIYIKMGFFIQKIPCGLVSGVAKLKGVGYFMFYTALDAKPSQIKINVTDEDFDTLLKTIKEYNHLIVYEVIEGDSKK